MDNGGMRKVCVRKRGIKKKGAIEQRDGRDVCDGGASSLLEVFVCVAVISW